MEQFINSKDLSVKNNNMKYTAIILLILISCNTVNLETAPAEINWDSLPRIAMNIDTIPVRQTAQVKLFDAIWDSGWTSYIVRSTYEDGQPQTLMEYLLHHDTLTIQPTPADSLLKRAKVIIAGGKTFIEKP
jgi:hypothetical protein